jgi:hypothetical protein
MQQNPPSPNIKATESFFFNERWRFTIFSAGRRRTMMSNAREVPARALLKATASNRKVPMPVQTVDIGLP